MNMIASNLNLSSLPASLAVLPATAVDDARSKEAALEPGEQPDGAASRAFADYAGDPQPAQGHAVVSGSLLSRKPRAAPEAMTPSRNGGNPADRPAGIDAKAVVENIAKAWEKAGVDPAWIQTIRDPQSWRTIGTESLPALVKPGEDLQRSGDFSTLRTQAIRVLRGTQRWQYILDNRRAESPDVPRWLLDHRLVQELFSWKDGRPRDNALVLDRLVNAKTIAEGSESPRKPQSAELPVAVVN